MNPHETASAALLSICIQKELMIATAESCTGGGVAKALTDIAGSSAMYDRGFVTYSNDAKMELLGVRAHTLETCGAVSSETAAEMALGTLRHSNADLSVATTGIAGPTGATADKPVGLVWFGVARRNNPAARTEHRIFAGDRVAVREAAIAFALNLLIEEASAQP